MACWDPEQRKGGVYRASQWMRPSPRPLFQLFFQMEVPGPSLLTPCPNPGPRPALGTLGSDPFFSQVSASLPAGAASCSVRGSEWIEVMEQMAVTFSCDLPACVGTSDPEVNACAWSLSCFGLQLWDPVPFQRLFRLLPRVQKCPLRFCGLAGTGEKVTLMQAVDKSQPLLCLNPPFHRELKAPGSLYWINLMLSLRGWGRGAFIINPTLQMGKQRQEEDGPGTCNASGSERIYCSCLVQRALGESGGSQGSSRLRYIDMS